MFWARKQGLLWPGPAHQRLVWKQCENGLWIPSTETARDAGLPSGQRAIAIRFPHPGPVCAAGVVLVDGDRPEPFPTSLPLLTPRGAGSPRHLTAAAGAWCMAATWGAELLGFGLEVTKGASNITTISRHDEQWNSPPEASFWKSARHRNVSSLYSRPLCFSLYITAHVKS